MRPAKLPNQGADDRENRCSEGLPTPSPAVWIRNRIAGFFIYALGDTVAALATGGFSFVRLLGIMLVGGLVYASEIPAYFAYIDRKLPKTGGRKRALIRASLAMGYFNPLWIARHLFFLKLFQAQALEWSLLQTACWSFLGNIPISFAGNYLIQNQIALKYRFVASASFSTLMAIYYGLSPMLFG